MKKRMIWNTAAALAIVLIAGAIVVKWKSDNTSLLYQAHGAIKETYGDFYIPNKEISLEALVFDYGLPMADAEDFIAECAMMTSNVDLFIGIKAHRDKGEVFANALESLKMEMVFNNRTNAAKLAKIKASEVYRFGDYVFFMVLGQNTDTIISDEAAYMDVAMKESEKGIAILGNLFK